MSVTQTKRDIQKEETRERIIQAATSLFRRYTPAKVSVRDIANEAGLTTGSLYHHFKSKEDLMKEIGFERNKDVKEIYESCLNDGSYIEILISFLKKIVRYEFQTEGRDTTSKRLRNRVYDGRAFDHPAYNPMPRYIEQLIAEAQKNGELDPLWPTSEIGLNIATEVWGVHHDFAIMPDLEIVDKAIDNRIPLILRSFMPGTYEKRNWYKSAD